jgi:hypothetical protein
VRGLAAPYGNDGGGENTDDTCLYARQRLLLLYCTNIFYWIKDLKYQLLTYWAVCEVLRGKI